MFRLDRLQTLADKLSTDCRTCENHVDSLSRRLAEVWYHPVSLLHLCHLTALLWLRCVMDYLTNADEP